MTYARARPLLGTIVSIAVRDRRPAGTLTSAMDAAFAAIARVHARMSFHDPASDISRLNRSAHREPIAVDPWTRAVLRLAARIAHASDGAFDVTVAPHLMRWRLLPPVLERRPGRPRDIVIEADGRVCFARPLAIDLGGIAKGYAVDRAAAVLEREDLRRYVINAGGDLRIGAAPEPVHLRDPRHPGAFGLLGEFANCALATSARTFSARRHDGRRVHAIVDPLTAGPARHRGSITVLAPDCASADALTKVVAVRGAAADAVLARFGARRAGLFT